MKKFKKTDDSDITDLLLHSIQYLDKAAEMAEDQDNPKLLIEIHKQALKASDRIMSVFMSIEQREVEDDTIGNTKGNFGFVTDGIPAQGERELEEDRQRR